ncbi:MAG: HDOD domain-containing protein [Betaproteobacteria bacterium]|nr:HDOD domain-containing protein [Betaproteobacteria bacterium]
MDVHVIDYKNISVNPEVISKITKIDPESNNCLREIDNLLRLDQSIAALILRVANSPIYNRGNHIKTLPVAINTLGVMVIRSLALLALSRSIFTQSKNELMVRHVWQHSLLTAIASQAICKELDAIKEGEEAFVVGLLHDVGKVLLFSHFKEKYIEVLEYALKNNCTSAEAEQAHLKINHLDVAQQAIIEWKLPKYFGDYIGVNLEHLSSDQKNDKVQKCLAAANSLVKGAGIGSSLWDQEIRKNNLIALGLSSDLSDYLIDDAFMQKLMENEIYQQCL